MTSASGTTPCGCGGGTSHGGCGCAPAPSMCDCGGKGCDDCQPNGIERPRFFSGQLLTEGDLQLLSDYVATKDRLHNRFLHGAGVVCGLQVVCHPCEPGKVIVQPGAALDCCGNDIWVPCPVELDINAMIRALGLKMRAGYDCGDPCERDCEDSPDDVRCVERKGRRYCLYIRYCENLTDPVAPYTADPSCAVQTCEPTRIAEGYEFELRCPEEDPEEPSLWQAILCCIGDLAEANRAAEDAGAAAQYGFRREKIQHAMRLGRVPRFAEGDEAALGQAVEQLSALDLSAERREDGRLGEAELRKALDAYQTAAAAVVRYDLQSGDDKAALEDTRPDLRDQVSKAREYVLAASPVLESLGARTFASSRDRLVAELWTTQGRAFVDPRDDTAERFTPQKIQFAYQAPYSAKLNDQFANDLTRLRQWLLGRLEARPLFGDCRLRREVLCIDIPRVADTDPDAMAKAATKLVEALLRYLIDCICAALNPPCRTCEDPAVKLACLEVEDCEVIRICNLERTFVWSGPAFRYWLPWLRAIGDLFERICCETRIRIKPPKVEEPAGDVVAVDPQVYMSQTMPAYAHVAGAPQLDALFKVAGVTEAQLAEVVNLGGSLTRATELGIGPTPGFAVDVPNIAARAEDAAVSAVLDRPEVRQRLVGDVMDEVAEIRTRLGEVSEPAVSEETIYSIVDRRLSGKFRSIDQRLDRRLTPSQLESSEVFKALTARATELEKRIAWLEKGGER